MEKMPTYFTADHAISMTLRDYFAGQALTGFLSAPEVIQRTLVEVGSENGADSPQTFASAAYELADAMLKEREK